MYKATKLYKTSCSYSSLPQQATINGSFWLVKYYFYYMIVHLSTDEYNCYICILFNIKSSLKVREAIYRRKLFFFDSKKKNSKYFKVFKLECMAPLI